MQEIVTIESADLADELVMYFVEHGMQVLTGVGLFVAGLFCALGGKGSASPV